MRKIMFVGLIALLLLSGCGWEEYPHRFEKGDYVVTKLDGRKGMVISTYKYHGGLWVRFSSHTDMTTDSFLGGLRGGTHDVTSKPYAVIRMQEFELEPYRQ
jgi:hypothetical protein